MEIKDISKYKTRVGVGTNDIELKNKTGFDLVSGPIDDIIEEELQETVENSQDYDEAVADAYENDIYGDVDTENVHFENQLKGMYFPSEYLKNNLNVTTEKYKNSTIFNFSPVVLQCIDKDNKNATFFINLGPNITIYKADSENTKDMTKLISMDDEYPAPYLNFFVNESSYNIESSGNNEKHRKNNRR